MVCFCSLVAGSCRGCGGADRNTGGVHLSCGSWWVCSSGKRIAYSCQSFSGSAAGDHCLSCGFARAGILWLLAAWQYVKLLCSVCSARRRAAQEGKEAVQAAPSSNGAAKVRAVSLASIGSYRLPLCLPNAPDAWALGE